jgi:hypothetical protein
MALKNWKIIYKLLFFVWMFFGGTIFSYTQIKLPGFRESYFTTIQREVTNWQIYLPDNRLFEFRKDGTVNEYQLVQKNFSLVEYTLGSKIEIGDLYRKSGTSDELFIPNPQNINGKLNNTIRCRPSATGPSSFWRSCGAIVNPLFDYELEYLRSNIYSLDKDGYEQFTEKTPNYYSSFPITVRYNLEPIAQKALSQIPTHLDESIYPIGDDHIEYDLNILSKNTSLVGNRIRLFLAYQGDIQYWKEIIWDVSVCHLDPIYPYLIFSARPEISKENNQAYLILADPQIETGILEEYPTKTDTHCSFLNIPMRGLMLRLLNENTLKERVLNKVREMKMAFPTDVVLHKLNTVFKFGSGNGCFYPNVKGLKFGQLSGTISSAELPLVATSTSKLSFSSNYECREPVSEPLFREGKIPKTVDKFRLTIGIQFDYSRIEQEIKKYLQKHPDSPIKEISLKYYRTDWFLMNAKFSEASGLGEQEFEIGPYLDESGSTISFIINPTNKSLKGKNETEKELLYRHRKRFSRSINF